MKITNFLNTNELLNILENNPQDYKLNKSKFIKLPKLSVEVFKEKPFVDTTINVIAVVDDLFVIDCDNVYSFNYIYSHCQRLNVKTLITKSPYGGHFFFRIERPLSLKHLKFDLKDVDDLENPLEYHLSSQQLNIEFYDKTSSSGKPRMIFDGFNNGYYKTISEVTEPQPMPEDFKIFLLDLASSFYDEFSTKSRLSPKGKLFLPNAYKGTFIKQLIDKVAEGKEPTEDDVYIFKTLYEKTSRKITLPIPKGQRNSLLWSIASWAGSSCYLESEENWYAFVEIINNSPLFMSEPITKDELYATILKKGRFSTHYYTKQETIDKQEAEKFLKYEDTQKFNPNNCKRFLAYNINSKSPSEDIVLVDLSVSNFVEVRYIRNTNAALRECKNFPDLYAQHVETLLTKEGEKEHIDIDNLPRLEIDVSDSCISPKAFTKLNGSWVLHTSFFMFNNDISKILMDSTNPDNYVTKEEFEETAFYKVLSKNLFPDPVVRLKFLNDLRQFLITKKGLQTMVTIVDIQGSTGKDSILLNYLSHLIYGLNRKETDILSNSIMYRKAHPEARNPTLTDIIESSFNDDFTSCLVGITEDGARPNLEQFCLKMQSVIKSPKIRIHRKFKESYSINNHLFLFRGTNSRVKPFTDGTNTRYYVSIAERYYLLGEDECEKELFPQGREKTLQNDYMKILKFLLLNDEYFKDALGYSELPPLPANLVNETDITNEDIAEMLNDNLTTPYIKAKDILDTLMPSKDEMNLPLIKDILQDKSHVLHDIARTLITLYSYKYKTHYQLETMQDVFLQNLITSESEKTIGLSRYPSVSSFINLISNIKGVGKISNKQDKNKLISLICLRFTQGSQGGSTKLKYYGKLDIDKVKKEVKINYFFDRERI